MSNKVGYREEERMPADWVCRLSKETCLIAARKGYLARLCRRKGECLEPGRKWVKRGTK